MNWIPDTHYKSREVAQNYDHERFSSIAGRVFNHLEKRAVVKCFADIPQDGTIVDAPCGTGRLAEPLLAAGYRVHGLDISEAMLEVARQRLRGYKGRFTCGVADMKSHRDSGPTYDAALCARVLMHFPLDQQIEFLSGVARLSRSIVVINHSLSSPYQRLRRRIKHWLGHQASAGHPVTNSEIKALLSGAGLRETRRRRLVSLISEAVYIVAEKTGSSTTQGGTQPESQNATVAS